jgi:16S rRNA (guanine527-N7)-methyltransferase
MNGLPDFETLLAPHAEPPVRDRLVRYAELLERWSGRHNLVRYATRSELVERHIVDSLAGREALPERGTMVDVGSGAGLPGVPLLAAMPGWSGLLVEPRQKRWAFLRTVIRELDLQARAERARYQDLGGDHGGFDAVVVRAVGGYDALLRWARGRLSPGGQVLIWSTSSELARFKKFGDWRVLSSRLPGLTHGRLVQLQPCFT